MANEIERHDGARAAQELGYAIPACGALGKAMQQHDRRGFGSLAFPDGEAVARAIMLEEPLSFRHGAASLPAVPIRTEDSGQNSRL